MNSDFVFALDNSGWPVLLVDASARICRANAPAARLFGFTPGLELPYLSKIWAQDNSASPESFLDRWEFAPAPSALLSFLGHDGETLRSVVSLCATLYSGKKLFVFQLLPAAADAGANNKTQIGESASAQQQKLECALQLARTVALDFNNALTSILGHTSFILGEMEPEHPWRASLLEVEKSAAKAAEIANDLGAFSRQDKEARGQAARNLNVVLQRTIEFFQRKDQSQRIHWQLQPERQLFTSRFDEAKMQQAFIKIIENALEAMSGPGSITIQTRNVELSEPTHDRNFRLDPGAYVSVEISDTGEGIPAAVLPRIFEPFFSTKRGAHRGLGLAWVYGIVTNHGGGVSVSSQPCVGTSVRVYLPAETQVVKDDATQYTSLSGHETVLIVDDEDLLLTMGQTILTSYGYGVLTANSGQKALELLSANTSIDLMVTDLVMPSMSGRELIEHVRQKFPAVKVLCTSGYVRQGAPDDEDVYLQKPFTARELLVKVRQALAAPPPEQAPATPL